MWVGFVVRFACVDVYPSALKHGVAAEDIEHALRNAIGIDELDDDLCLYLGPGRDGSLLEVVTLAVQAGEMVIHAMGMRPKYRRLLPGG
jgi:hypothetical protein